MERKWNKYIEKRERERESIIVVIWIREEGAVRVEKSNGKEKKEW